MESDTGSSRRTIAERVSRNEKGFRVAYTLCSMLTALGDLRVPPGNRLERLTGDRRGQHSIRVNERYRICFMWTDAGPAEVEVVDYH